MVERYEPGPVPRDNTPQAEPPPANRTPEEIASAGMASPVRDPAIQELINITTTPLRGGDLDQAAQQRLALARQFRQRRQSRSNGS